MAGAVEIRRDPNHPKIYKVIPPLLQMENANDYQPVAVSFGPYHHGEERLAFVEAFKPRAVELFVSRGEKDKKFYYDQILNIIHDIRNYYQQTEELERYTDDKQLAQMMLRDAALLIMYMEIHTAESPKKQENACALVDNLGTLALEVLPRDMALLENQIPLQVITELVDLRDGNGRGDDLVRRSMTLIFFGERVTGAVQHKISYPPHLLDVIRHLHISQDGEPKDKKAENRTRSDDSLKHLVPVYRSATDLKAKGIHFKPSPTQSLSDVDFQNYILFARLWIPAFTADGETKVLFRNMIAYELSPGSPAKGEIASFVEFIKSLIERAEDVKELREKKILLNKLGSDQEVVNVLKDINTHEADDEHIYKNVRDKIRAHCDSKMSTWIAQFLQKNFKNPWTVFAFLIAGVLLVMSFVQLYLALYNK